MGRRKAERYGPTDDDRRLVERASGYGMTPTQIAQLLKRNGVKLLSAAEVREHFEHELEVGGLKLLMKAGDCLSRQCDSDNVLAAIYVSKTRGNVITNGGYQEKYEVRVSRGDIGQMPEDELDAIIAEGAEESA